VKKEAARWRLVPGIGIALLFYTPVLYFAAVLPLSIQRVNELPVLLQIGIALPFLAGLFYLGKILPQTRHHAVVAILLAVGSISFAKLMHFTHTEGVVEHQQNLSTVWDMMKVTIISWIVLTIGSAFSGSKRRRELAWGALRALAGSIVGTIGSLFFLPLAGYVTRAMGQRDFTGFDAVGVGIFIALLLCASPLFGAFGGVTCHVVIGTLPGLVAGAVIAYIGGGSDVTTLGVIAASCWAGAGGVGAGIGLAIRAASDGKKVDPAAEPCRPLHPIS
jgi:hypothetical protein